MDPIFPAVAFSFDNDHYNNNYNITTNNSIINSSPQTMYYPLLPALFNTDNNNNNNTNNTYNNNNYIDNNSNNNINRISMESPISSRTTISLPQNIDFVPTTQSLMPSINNNIKSEQHNGDNNDDMDDNNKKRKLGKNISSGKKITCVVCRAAKSSCSGKRPCDRCIRLKKTDLCEDPQPGKNNRKSNTVNKQTTSRTDRSQSSSSNKSSPKLNPTTPTVNTLTTLPNDSENKDNVHFNYDLELEEHRRRLSSVLLHVHKHVLAKALFKGCTDADPINDYLCNLYSTVHVEDFISFLESIGYKRPESLSLHAEAIKSSITPARSSRNLFIDFSKFIPPPHLKPLPTSFVADYSLSPIHAIEDDVFALPFFVLGFSNLLFKFGVNNCCSLQTPCDCNCTKKQQKIQEIKKQQDELKEKHSKNANNVHTGSLIVHANESFERLFGYKQEEIREMFMKQGPFCINSLFRSDYLNELHRIDHKAARGHPQFSNYVIAISKWNHEIPILLLRKIVVDKGSALGGIWFFIPANQPISHSIKSQQQPKY